MDEHREPGPGLHRRELAPGPVEQFGRWFADATAAGQPEPEAMCLATATAAGVPSARWVLLKAFDEAGFVFYTNEHSRKARELAGNPHAALAWRWVQVHRAVRVTGPVERVDAEQADAYFASRPRDSQIGAWASSQSTVVAERAELDARVAEVEERFAGAEVPRPPHWGGYRVRPVAAEFWQAGAGRLHDRFGYRRDGGSWVVERLSP